ncbi:MAG: L-2-hydroxyglutarate oxidase [Ignavibacteria bacterium]|nr:L-2-hydroxyglutarate oxidase [Ignavibacteria bacterium]
MNSKLYDIVIIGGGIIGCATSMALLNNGNYKILLIEAENKLAAHQTGNNSGVIHSGLYYKPGSLKANNCTQGRQLLYIFCEEHNIKFEKCGKVVVAVSTDEIKPLNDLYDRGIANGLDGLKKLTAEELKNYEPHITGTAGLLVSQTGIVDFLQVTNTYAKIINDAGGEIKTGCRFISVSKSGKELVLKTTTGDIKSKFLVNCGGLYSDRIAKTCGVNPGLQIIPFRGEYYKLRKGKEYLVKNLIYPVPDPEFPFLGVHFTRMINSGIEVGPNAVLAFKREGYKKTDFSFKDFTRMMTNPGFWKMATKYYKMGSGELYRSFSRKAFVKALQKLVPDVELNDITKGGAGV